MIPRAHFDLGTPSRSSLLFLGAGVCTTPCRPASTASRQRSPASETLSRGGRRLSISDQKCHFLTVTQFITMTHWSTQQITSTENTPLLMLEAPSVRRRDCRAASRGTDGWLWARDHEAGCIHNGYCTHSAWGASPGETSPAGTRSVCAVLIQKHSPTLEPCPARSKVSNTIQRGTENGILHQPHLSVRVPTCTCGRLPLRGEGGADSTKRADRKRAMLCLHSSLSLCVEPAREYRKSVKTAGGYVPDPGR